ncbi:MAG: peroxiredoxin [Proteobacteria bacterium]|jgi:Peroxiredoxin|nr:MAG: peroxiredoxin [Pseudomonadota bacterium]
MSWPWPAPVDDGAARHLVPGLAMPDIALPSTSGRTVSLARVLGRAVVFCYPWTGRPGVPNPPNWDEIPGAHGSTPEAEGFRDLYLGFEEMPTAVFGLSMQPTEEQQEFATRLRLPFELLSDAEGRLRDALRLPVFETGGRQYLKRLTMILRDGHLEHVYYPVHPPNTHAREVLAYVTATATYEEESRLRPAPKPGG